MAKFRSKRRRKPKGGPGRNKKAISKPSNFNSTITLNELALKEAASVADISEASLIIPAQKEAFSSTCSADKSAIVPNSVKRKPGRPRIYSLNDRIDLAILVSKFGCSFNKAGEIYQHLKQFHKAADSATERGVDASSINKQPVDLLIWQCFDHLEPFIRNVKDIRDENLSNKLLEH